MKVLSYNVRGLGGIDKRNEVCRLVSEKKSLCFMHSGIQVVCCS